MSAPGKGASAHVDQFVKGMLPPAELMPDMDFSGTKALASYPDRLNITAELLTKHIEEGNGDRPALHFGDVTWTYNDLQDKSSRIARILMNNMGVKAGNRVLLRAPNNPMAVACWFAILKAGAVVVATMPLLRAKELKYIIQKANVTFALCDLALQEELDAARMDCKGVLTSLKSFTPLGDSNIQLAHLDWNMQTGDGSFGYVNTSADDPAIIAFTSGTTGDPKGTIHFHRDLLAAADCFPQNVLPIKPSDRTTGSPPLAFTFGLGAFVLFPMRYGASTILLPIPTPDLILEAIVKYKATTLYTAPTMYRALMDMVKNANLNSLKWCISAGEHLPKATWEDWHETTGIKIIDGIGSTELLHIFISAGGGAIRPGSTGKAIPGYQAKIVDDEGNEKPRGEPGHLAVKGPTGCRYLENEERQRAYVQDGWNLTGDIFSQDEEGYFWFVARGDDMIISAGYNISGPEVEDCLLTHPNVFECAVIASPDEERGNIVHAYVVLNQGGDASEYTAMELQNFVKKNIAPYKYPRAITFVNELPKTQTGKLQRFKLRER
ncbi:MAG: AMP-binding protein [Rhodospirillales bacterium]|nr:AMP-binding protein [Rhodospirillales bacterium]